MHVELIDCIISFEMRAYLKYEKWIETSSTEVYIKKSLEATRTYRKSHLYLFED